MAEKYIIQGYEFHSKEEALEGKKEMAAVKVLSEKVANSSLENALKIYEKLLKQNMFHTQVGIEYLQSLKNYLADNNVILDTSTSGMTRKIDRLTEELEKEKKKSNKQMARLKELLYSSLIFNLILMTVVVIMIVIASTSKSATVLNYESKLQDRYAQWEQELQSKEAALKIIEQSLAAAENK